MDTLTPEQQDSLSEFVAVTGLSLDNGEVEAKAIALLSYHAYNLNNAVLAYFDSGLDLPVPEPEPAQQIQPQADDGFSSLAEGYDGGIYRNLQGDFALVNVLPRLAKAPKISNKWQLNLGIHVSRKAFRDIETKEPVPVAEKPKKVSLLWIIFLLIPKSLSLLYSAFRYLFGLNLPLGFQDTPKAQFDFEAYDENYCARRELLDEETSNLYNIATERFNECHEASQQNFHFLIGILCDNHSTHFIQKVLNNQRFQDLFSKSTGQFKETLLFVNNVDKNPEAFEVAQTYNCRRFPFVFFVGNVSRDPAVMASMSIIYKANCALGDDEEQEVLIQRITSTLSKTSNDYNPQLVTKRYDKQEIEMSRLIKEKQDEAYLESLENDKVKKMEKENERLRQESQTKLRRIRKGFIKNLDITNHFENQLSGLLADQVVRISIKLPDGRRILQKFPKSCSIGQIYLFVETILEPGQENDEVEPVQMSIADFLREFKFSFELFKPLPKCHLPSSTQTIEEFGDLKSGDSILFELIDNDEDVM